MVLRRELLPLLLAVAVLLITAGQASAAPTWLVSEPAVPAGSAPDVTADQDGRAAAVWNAAGHIRVARRPRGGPWSASEDLTPAGGATGNPRLVFLPDGELVVAWQAASDVLAVTQAPGGDWSDPQTVGTDCCALLEDAVAGADGTALVFWNSADGTAATAVKPPGANAFQPPQALSLNLEPTEVAVAPDGSALSAAPGLCGAAAAVPCVRAQYRPPGGTWGNPEMAAPAGTGATSLGLAARSGAAPFTVAWGESSGSVRSADRAAGGSWSQPIGVPGTPGGIVGAAACPAGYGCLDLAGRANRLAVVWQQGSSISGSVRDGAGAWAVREPVGSADAGAADTEAAITAAGTGITAWLARPGPTSVVVRGSHRNAGGTWTTKNLGTPAAGRSLQMGDVAADGGGDGIAGYADPSGSRVAGFDATGPRFTALSFPSGGSLTFSATAEDNWSGPPGISWLFGDGSSASGGTVSHAYGSAGTFTATATATDAVGNATSQSGPVTVTKQPPPPPPCGTADTDSDGINDGCDESNGALVPQPFKTVNAKVVSGEVFVKLPGASSASAAQVTAPRGFRALEGAETIPVGAQLDTTRGRVTVRSAATTRRKVQSGQFFRGRFQIRQLRIKKRSRRLITNMRLTGSSFKKACGANRASISKRSRKRVRRLFGNAKGRFRTTGRNAAATVRGTRWSIQDRCDGTKVTVQRGRVAVRDNVRRKTVIVRTGRTYLARAR